MKLIDKIASLEKDTIGMSAAMVYKCIVDGTTVYLKEIDKIYSPTTYSVGREAQMMQWLDGKINVPKVLECGEKENKEYLIMSELPGETIDNFSDNPEEFIGYYAKALNALWSIDIKDCPWDSGVELRLSELRYLLDNNLAYTDDEDWEDSTSFENPEEFYEWLCDNKPEEEPSFSHGDISNIYISEGKVYFFDLARCGVCDKYQDIALAIREIRHFYNNNEDYERKFLDMLGISVDHKKLNYYLLLDEMF